MDFDDDEWCDLHDCLKDEDGCIHCKNDKHDRDFQERQDAEE